MASKSLQTRLEQKAHYAKRSEIREGLLKEKGLDEKDIPKDSQIKHFKARIKQIDGALARISFLENQTKQMKERKEQRKVEAEQAKAEAMTSRTKSKAKAAAKEKAPATKKKAAAGGKAPAKAKPDTKKKSK